jgi:capsule polysaccharide export protein KpsE/RkpR
LQHRYGDVSLERAREKLAQRCATRLDKKAGAVVLTCEDRDPAMAQRLVEAFGQLGNSTFRRVSASTAGEERRFLEQRVHEARADLDAAAQRLREFQKAHKIVDLGEQSKAVVSAIASLEGELLSKQMQLSYLHSYSSENETNALQLRQQLAVMESKLRALEEPPVDGEAAATAKKPSGRSELFPAAMAVPELRYELEQLFREQKIQETLFLLLTQRLELAKVNEARDTSAFQVLDAPVVATEHARPKRALLVLTGTLGALLLMLASVWLGPWWRARREEDERAQWTSTSSTWKE